MTDMIAFKAALDGTLGVFSNVETVASLLRVPGGLAGYETELLAASALQSGAIGSTVQPYSNNLNLLAGVDPGPAGLTLLNAELPKQIRAYIKTMTYVDTVTDLENLDTNFDKLAYFGDRLWVWTEGNLSKLVSRFSDQ